MSFLHREKLVGEMKEGHLSLLDTLNEYVNQVPTLTTAFVRPELEDRINRSHHTHVLYQCTYASIFAPLESSLSPDTWLIFSNWPQPIPIHRHIVFPRWKWAYQAACQASRIHLSDYQHNPLLRDPRKRTYLITGDAAAVVAVIVKCIEYCYTGNLAGWHSLSAQSLEVLGTSHLTTFLPVTALVDGLGNGQLDPVLKSHVRQLKG